MMEDGTSLGNHRLSEWDRGIDFYCLTMLANTWPLLQEGHRSTRQTTVVHEFIADRTARPAAAKERDVTIQPFLTYLACARFDAQQHRFPIATGFSNTHKK